MLRIALELVANRRSRYAMTAAAIGMVVLLFVLVTSALDGLLLTFVGHVDQTSADLWVLPPSDQTIGTFIKRSVADDLIGVPGVADVERVLEVPAYLDFEGADSRVILCGYDIDGFNQPDPIVDGFAPSWPLAPGLVIDRSLAMGNPGLGVGSLVTIGGERFEVTGLTQGHQLYAAYPVAFVPADVLSIGGGLTDQASYFLVRTERGVDPDSVARSIKSVVPDVLVYTKTGYVENMLADFAYATLVLSALQVATAALGTLIVGVTVYTSVLERVREFGIIKAIGGTGWYLSRLVLLDGVLLAVPGYVVGAAAAAVAVAVLPGALPIRVEFEPAVFAAAAGLALAVSLAGCLFGVRHALRIDPAVAIRGN